MSILYDFPPPGIILDFVPFGFTPAPGAVPSFCLDLDLSLVWIGRSFEGEEGELGKQRQANVTELECVVVDLAIGL